MGSEVAAPLKSEVRAVAELLGRRPSEVSAIKVRVPGPGGTVLTVMVRMPELEGFAPPAQIRIPVDDETLRPGVRYDSPAGSIIVVSHETGPEIFFDIVAAGAAAAELIRAAYDFIRWLRARRPSGGSDDVDAEASQFWFVEDGQEKLRKVLPLEGPE